MNSMNHKPNFLVEMDIKPCLEPESTICRCCFSNNRLVCDISAFQVHFLEVAGINVMDECPRWICYECRAVLLKAYRFKMQVVRAQKLWFDYISKCAPLSVDGQDIELKSYTRPHLLASETLCLDTSEWSPDVLEHKKQILETELTLPVLEIEADVKTEIGFSDYEDNITLEDFKLINAKQTESLDVNSLIEEAIKSVSDDNKRKEHTIKKEKSSRKCDDKEKRRKRKVSTQEVDKIEIEIDQPKKRLRNPVEVDTNKIEIITLDPEREFQERKKSYNSESTKFPHRCPHCYIGFNYDYKLENHMRKHKPSRGRFHCDLCSMYFPTAYSHKVHMYTHTRRYRCRACNVIMRDYTTISNHYRSHHEGITPVFTCEICGKISNNSKTHRGHVRNSHGARPECAHCGKTFVNLSSLTEHLQIHQGVKNFECPQCGKKFRTRNQVQHHQSIHSNVRDYYCVECDARFKSAQNLKQHLEKSLKHKDTNSFKFACTVCGRRVESAAALARHVAIQHDRVREYACHMCSKALASNNALNKHLRIVHAGQRPPPNHVCHHCGRAFSAKSTLTNHVRTHTGEKPFSCALCARSFTQRSALSTHRRLVHGDKKSSRKLAPVSVVDPEGEEKPRVDAWGRDSFFSVAPP